MPMPSRLASIRPEEILLTLPVPNKSSRLELLVAADCTFAFALDHVK
jgi:hypothetical protein